MAHSEVRGIRATAAAIRSLAREMSRGRVQEVHEQALEPIQRSARSYFNANGSFVTGVVPENIVVVHTSRRESKLTLAGMGAKIGHLIELGTEPHEQPNRGIVHPGAAPKPFMAPGFEDGAPESLRLAGALYGAQLSRIGRALRRT